MIQLGVATIHFRYPRIDESELHELARSFFEIAERGVHDLVPLDADVVLDIEQSSLKVRSRIIATGIAVGTFLSQYGSVRQGAEYLGKDIYKAADFFIEKVEQAAGIRTSDVIAKRRTASFARRTKRIFEEVEDGRINSDEAMRQLVTLLDADSEGMVPRGTIDALKKEIEETQQHNQEISTSNLGALQPNREIPRKRLPPTPRERLLRPRRLRVSREDGQLTIAEVDS